MIKVIDTRNDFIAFIKEGSFTVESYMQYYFEPNRAVLEGLAVTHLKDGIESLSSVVSEIDFAWYAAQAEKLKEKKFIDATYDMLKKAFDVMSIDQEIEVDCYLLYGFGTMTGCLSYVNGKAVLLVGLEHVDEYPIALGYEYFLIHELHHVLRYSKRHIIEEASQMTLENNYISKAVADALVNNTTLGMCFVDEGLACLSSAHITGTPLDEITQARVVSMYPEDLNKIKAREHELMARAEALFDSNEQNVVYEWTFSNHGLKSDVPERALYYLGLKAMNDLLEQGQFTFAELTDMTAEKLIGHYRSVVVMA